ncbi:zinc finger protein 831 [Microcaecilia unicolor]|uniref:Zinc finger protein 831 n=1 Tax=Microcaecilia unicolor TaxID=1415580 RepID=A0A6P7Z1I6_9AMPH|nr:zinc finger protein 831 [Microcaecilia unicolor]
MEAERTGCTATFSPPPAPAVYVKALTVPVYQLQLQPVTLNIALAQPGPAQARSGRHLCPHCGRDCLKPSVLEKHVRSHTGERPFPCTTCRVAFKTQSNLYKHRRTQTHVHNARLAAPGLHEDQEQEVQQQQPGGRSSDRSAVRKCESTDSGYLSHADSAELQGWGGGSPLHGLSEQSLPEAEGPDRKRLEEHIAKLISHNKALVDDTQLDNVRPRKTALSKQGSLDLPMPYTYKDSFHFDIKPLDGTRKKTAALIAAKSSLMPLGKTKPLFFHSVPTQFSTTIDCVPVARSNSMPFVEGTRTLQEKLGSSKSPFLTQNPLNNSFSSLLHSINQMSTPSIDFPISHPRGLVRQAAVDELQLSNSSDHPPSEGKPDGKKQKGEASAAKCKTASKKGSQKKLKMFSQEKWQIYGDETFKKLYQKMTDSESAKKQKHGEICSKELTASVPNHQKLTRTIAVGQYTDGGVPNHGSLLPSVEISSALTKTAQSDDVSSSSQLTHGGFTELMEIFRPTDPGEKREKRTCSVQEQKALVAVHSGQRSSSPSSTNAPASDFQQASDLPSKKLIDTDKAFLVSVNLQHSHLEEQTDLNVLNQNLANMACCHGERNAQEGCHQTQMILTLHDNGSHQGNDQESEKLPSERKKLKVEELQSADNSSVQPGPSKEQSSGTDGTIPIDAYNDSLASTISIENEGKKSTGTQADSYIGSFEDEQKVKNRTELLDNWVNLKHVLGSADTLLSTFCSAFQGSAPPRENDQVSTKQGEGCSSYNLNHSSEDDGKSLAPSQNCPGSPPVEKTFSPKYLLRLPHADALSHPLEKEMVPAASGPVAITKGLCSIPSAPVSAGPAPTFLFPLQPQPVHESVLKGLVRDTYVQENLDQIKSKVENIRPETKSAENSREVLPLSPGYNCSFIISSSDVGESQHLQKASNVYIVAPCSSKGNSTEHNKKPPEDQWEAGDTCPNSFIHAPQSSKYSVCKSEMPSYFNHYFGSFYCHTVTTQQRGSSSFPNRSLTFHSGNNKVPDTKASFPCLNTEPRITWCCLTRNLPLPTVQKEKSHFAHCSQVCSRNKQSPLSRHDAFVLDPKNTGKCESPGLTTTGNPKTLVSASLQKERQGNSVSVAGSFAKGREIPCRNEKLAGNEASGGDDLQEIKVTKNRYRTESPGSAHFKAHRLCKQHRLPSKGSLPARRAGQKQERRCCFPKYRTTAGILFKKTVGTRCSKKKSSSVVVKAASGRGLCGKVSFTETAPGLQTEASNAVCCGDDCKTVVQGGENHLRTVVSRSATSDHFREKDDVDAQDSAGPFDEGAILDLTPQTLAASSPRAPTSLTGASFTQAGSAPQAGVSLDICSPAALPSAFQKLLTAEPKQNSQSDLVNSSFWPSYPEHKETGRAQQLQALHSARIDPVCSESKVKNNKTGILNVESQGQSLAALNPLQPTLDRKDEVTERCVSVRQGTLSCTASVNAPKTSLEVSCAVSLAGAKEVPSRGFTLSTCQAFTEKSKISQVLSSRPGRQPETALTTSKAQSIHSTEKPSKTLKKRSLELMRNQTHVEYNDSSSDDEGKLVIEI